MIRPSGLKDADTFDIFEKVSLEFSGTLTIGSIEINNENDIYPVNSWTFTADKTEGISNGDKITVTADISDEEIEIIMNRHQFNGRQRLSYKELGQIYNKSTSQVNDMYILAVKKTGMCDDIKKLADIYNEEINAKKRIKRLEK